MPHSLQPHERQHTKLPCRHYLLEFAQTHVHWVNDASNHLILCCPLLLLPSIFPSFKVFSNEVALHIRQPKYRSFSFSMSPSNEYWGLISFRIDWFDLLSFQGILKSTQLSLWSNFHIHTWFLEKPWLWLHGTLLAKWCLCFDYRFVMAFHPRSEFLLILRL